MIGIADTSESGSGIGIGIASVVGIGAATTAVIVDVSVNMGETVIGTVTTTGSAIATATAIGLIRRNHRPRHRIGEAVQRSHSHRGHGRPAISTVIYVAKATGPLIVTACYALQAITRFCQ